MVNFSDVLEHMRACLLACGEALLMDRLDLWAMVPALHDNVVP